MHRSVLLAAGQKYTIATLVVTKKDNVQRTMWANQQTPRKILASLEMRSMPHAVVAVYIIYEDPFAVSSVARLA